MNLIGKGCSVVAPALLFAGSLNAEAELAHHWNFDDGPDWHDSAFASVCTNTVAWDAVAGADATLQHMGPTNWVSGRQFTALQFDGADEYLLVAANLADTLGASASLSFWIRTTQTGTLSAATAPGVTGVAGSYGCQWGWLDDAGRIALSADNALIACSATPINDGRWHHIVLTRDAPSGIGQVYVDGTLSGSGSSAAGMRTAAFSSLGRIENSSSSGFFRGRLDQVTAFKGVVSPAEITRLMANHAPKVWESFTEGVGGQTFSTVSVFAKAYDVENDALAVHRWTQPEHGSVTYNGDGSFSYAAETGYLGVDDFHVVVEDGQGGFYRARMNLSVISEPPSGGVPVTCFTNFAPIQTTNGYLSHSGWRTPRATDWNADGKLDLLIGAGGYVWLYANVGTAQAPTFASGVKVQAAGVTIYANTASSPIALVDMTRDGVPDLVVADSASKLRVYRNTAASNQPVVLSAPVFVASATGGDFVLPDRRFDLGDWDGDGNPDLVTGSFSGPMLLFPGVGTNGVPLFGAGQTLFSDSYNIYPRLFDLNTNGRMDLMRGINWGTIAYWRDVAARGVYDTTWLATTDVNGASADLKALTDGPVVDFGDFNGDGKFDILVGGHAGDRIYLGCGELKTPAESLAAIEAIYDAYPDNLGAALSTNGNARLAAINTANANIISHVRNGTPGMRETVFSALTNHIAKYSFLRYQTLDTAKYHHVPSIAMQNWVILQSSITDTPRNRQLIGDVMGLTGTARMIFTEAGLVLGDNAKSIPAAYGTIRDFLRRHPRELFPDRVLTIEGFYGDGTGGFIWTPNSAKNTFGDWALYSGNEWAPDLTTAIDAVLGSGAASGDYFTFVLGHEVTHSLDGYVASRANRELYRRWGLMLCTAAGPEVVPAANGWIDWTATQSRFQSHGLYNSATETWTTAWDRYWGSGSGAAFKNFSFMRFDISWFLSNSQESLATQANQHWANGPGRLIGAVDRFRRALPAGLPSMKANINEVVTLIDFLSAGMNRVNLVETKSRSAPQRVDWYDHYADLERNDCGVITSLSVDGHRYDFTVDTNGGVTDVRSTIAVLPPRGEIALSGWPHSINLQTNAYMLDGRPVEITSFAQPAHGTVTGAGGGVLIYQSESNYIGPDAFTYQVGSAMATVTMQVVGSGLSLLPDIWWPLDDGSGVRAAEFSPRQAFGNLINGPTWTAEGRWRGALSFDGTDDYVTAGTKPSMSGTAPFSLAAWVRTHEDWSKDGVVIQQRDWAGYNGEYMLLLKSNGQVSFLVYGDENYQFNFSSTNTVNDHQWHHIAAVRDDALGHIYVDGVLAASASGTARPLSAAIGVAIGADVRDNAAFFNGDLDDIRIYSRALSGDEVRTLCDQYRPRAPRFVDLTCIPGDDFQFQVADSDVTSYTLLASTDLLDWCEMTGELQYSGGVFRVTGSSMANQPRAFFRLRWPLD